MEISRRDRVLYSLWMLPLLPLVLMLLLEALYLSRFVVRDVVWFIGSLSTLHVLLNILIPLAYILGWVTSHAREDRLAALVATTAYFGLATITLGRGILGGGLWQLGDAGNVALGVVWMLVTVASIVYAFRVRKALVVRAVLWRSPEQVERRRLAREQAGEERVKARMARTASKAHREQELISRELGKLDGMARVQTAKSDAQQTPASFGESAAEASSTTKEIAPGAALAAAIGVASTPAPESGAAEPASAPASAAPREPAKPAATTGTPATSAGSIDINSCTVTELLAAPGMTVPLAKAIVAERDAAGPYGSLEQLITRNALKPHVVAPFIGYVRIEVPAPVPEPRGPHRARTLDL